MLKEGRKAPRFSLPSSAGGSRALADLAGKWVVLYFYPRDDTPGCTVEAKDFTAAKRKLSARGAVVLGVSKDSLKAHAKFIDKHALGVELLSDEDRKVHEVYGAWGEKVMYGKARMGVLRSTVLIDPDGKVAKVWPKVRVKGHVDDVIAELDRARAAREQGRGG